MTSPAISCAIPRSASEMSPPLLFEASTPSISALGPSPAPSNDSLVRPPRLPASTTPAYAWTESTTLSSSGKCRPYHSRIRAPSMFEDLSASSSAPTACMTCIAGSEDALPTRAEDSPMANSRSFASASRSSAASPASTIMACFLERDSSSAPSPIILQSAPADESSPSSCLSETSASASPMYAATSFTSPLPSFIPV